MIRIDESTYIDDTLVTCVEYQLFIDEMREQGKYYQPDHWTSYQFPAGQARTPIVGVRFSDAAAFCEWLTQTDERKWTYRLPAFTETEQYPLMKSSHSPLGYWIITQDCEAQFAWAGSVPVNPRALDFDRDINLDLVRAIYDNILLTRSRDPNRTQDIYREYAHPLDLARAQVPDVEKYRRLDIVRTRALALALDLDPKKGITPTDVCRYIDIYTLQERIAGRSPAFEGIRLVKELKKP
jgi:hypothetical protein